MKEKFPGANDLFPHIGSEQIAGLPAEDLWQMLKDLNEVWIDRGGSWGLDSRNELMRDAIRAELDRRVDERR